MPGDSFQTKLYLLQYQRIESPTNIQNMAALASCYERTPLGIVGIFMHFAFDKYTFEQGQLSSKKRVYVALTVS